jgi:hypothetical protein
LGGFASIATLHHVPFEPVLSKMKNALKAAVQFPYDKPLPKLLIRKIATFRAKQVRESDARWMYYSG